MTAKRLTAIVIVLLILLESMASAQTYKIVDTGQERCFDNAKAIECPEEGIDFRGQDAQYDGKHPEYRDNGDGTVTDLVTGLMWQKTPGEKVTFDEAIAGTEDFDLAGYDDWRLPTIKELYSLILFSGMDPSGPELDEMPGIKPFIDTDYFDFEYGNTDAGERVIDAQYWSATEYVSTTMGGSKTTFGVNFADGRIKGYGRELPGGRKMMQFVRYVRGPEDYGKNDFIDNNDGTVTDRASGLMWQKADDGIPRNWEQALAYAGGISFAGHSDWRLPNAKELQSIVDYTRSPSTTSSAAIDPVFIVSEIINEAGETDYPTYWTSTTHISYFQDREGANACYISFGRAMGYMNNEWMDVHGAGAQRSDPKAGNPDDYPTGHGPQGDAIRINNYVRCVRNIIEPQDVDNTIRINFDLQNSPNPFFGETKIFFSLESAANVRLAIYDSFGREHARIYDGVLESGDHSFMWKAALLPVGMYYCTLDAGGKRKTITLSLVK